jgi:hypothetical protein
MVPMLLRAAGLAIPVVVFLAFGAVFLAGLRARRREPADHVGTAIVAAIAFSLLPAGFIWLVGSSFACFDGGPECKEAARASTFPIAMLIAGVIALIGVAGYAAFARGRSVSVVLTAVLLTPIVFGAGMAAASAGAGALNNVASGMEVAQDVADEGNRSRNVHVTASDVHATLSADGQSVVGVTLHATVHVDVPIDLSADKDGNPRFNLLAPGSALASGVARQSGPTKLIAGSDTGYDLAFDTTFLGVAPHPGARWAGTYSAPVPGTWVLRVELLDAGGHLYSVDVDVEVAGPA